MFFLSSHVRFHDEYHPDPDPTCYRCVYELQDCEHLRGRAVAVSRRRRAGPVLSRRKEKTVAATNKDATEAKANRKVKKVMHEANRDR